MAQSPTNTIDTKSARSTLQSEIQKARNAVGAGEEAVRSSEAEGNEERLNTNKARLQNARRILYALESADSAMASVCCDEVAQNCPIDYI